MTADIALLAQGTPPHALVLAMALSYVLCFAGMLFAWVSYRRRQRQGQAQKREENDDR